LFCGGVRCPLFRQEAMPVGSRYQGGADARSRGIVLLLDCCYGGAFAQGVTVRATGDVNVLDSFPQGRSGGGRGRAVITASNAIGQYSDTCSAIHHQRSRSRCSSTPIYQLWAGSCCSNTPQGFLESCYRQEPDSADPRAPSDLARCRGSQPDFLIDLLRDYKRDQLRLHRVVLLHTRYRRSACRAGCYLVCHEPSSTRPRWRADLGLGHHCSAHNVPMGDLDLGVPNDLKRRSCLRGSKFRPDGHCCYAHHYLHAAASRAGKRSELTDPDLRIPYVPVL
jgi:hypothetical protein